MSSVLYLASPLKKGRETFTKSLLLSSSRTVDFTKDEQYPTTRTKLYYVGENDATVEFTLNHPMNTLATRMGSEDETNRVVKLQVLYYKTASGREKKTTTNTKIWELSTDRIIFGYDISSTQSYIFIDRGKGNVVRLTTSHVVADISRSVSRSQSLSAS